MDSFHGIDVHGSGCLDARQQPIGSFPGRKDPTEYVSLLLTDLSEVQMRS